MQIQNTYYKAINWVATCNLTVATLPSTIAKTFWTRKCTVVSRSVIRRDSVVNTFFGERTPPVAVNAVKMMNIIKVRDIIMKARLAARTNPARRMMKDSFLNNPNNIRCIEVLATMYTQIHLRGIGCTIGQSRIKAEECCSVRTGLKHNWVLTSH